jgi:hypothetical protein
MSHWHRSPSSISVATMLRRAKLRFILDDGLAAQLLSCLPRGAHTLRSLGFAQHPSREDVVALCHQNHGILVTADPAYAPLLIHDHKSSWGILLLPANKAVQLDRVRRLFAGIRPSVDRMVAEWMNASLSASQRQSG